MEYIIFAAVLFLFIVLLMVKGYLDYRRKEKDFIRKLYMEYGSLPQKEYTQERFLSISHYFEKHKSGFYIDDVTWNDLNMDQVFKQMNFTFSAAGEEYLYYTLRTPFMEKTMLQRREEIISYFQGHADERVKCQYLFSRLGRTGKFSIYDYLDYLDELGVRSNARHYAALVAVLLGIGSLLIHFPTGLMVLLGVFIYNIITYFKDKSEIDPYITSFSYIFRLMDMVERLCKIKVPALQTEWERMRKCVLTLHRFKRGSYLLMSPERMSGSSNPLEMILDYLRMVLHLDLIKFNSMLSEVRNHIEEIDSMLTDVGMVETMIAIGAFRAGHPDVCIPEFTDKLKLEAWELYHPLLHEPVKNNICVEKSVLITGSNASGKSTFLKTVALNQILAQTVHTCMAHKYRAGMFRIYSSMSLRDDLQGGDSYYMVEIKALKRIMDEIHREGNPVLCLVDEVLRGTNTVERIAASTQILKSLSISRCLCFAATHDIELTHLLEGEYDNYHFEEEIAAKDISFSYKLMNGRASTRNAIKLLGIMGYQEDMIQKAERMAADFVANGRWDILTE